MTPLATAGDLAVVIPTRGRPDRLRLTLEALAAQTEQGFETIVVVDGTDQEPPELAGARVLQQEHAGPGVARNLGVGASERPLVLFLGDDMIPRPELVARHLDQHRRHPEETAAVLGRIVWHPSVPRNRLHRWLDWSCALFDYRLLEEEGSGEAGWERFYSSNVSMKRELFLSAGGFDPDFGFDYEDLDLGWRLGQAGMRLLYERGAVAEHLHVYDWPALERRYASHAVGERLMADKHEWFHPWFHGQIETACGQPRPSPFWALVVDLIPRGAGRLRRGAERRADRHYLRRLAPAFMGAWDAAGQSEQRTA